MFEPLFAQSSTETRLELGLGNSRLDKCTYQLQSLLEEVEQGRLLLHLHELKRDLLEGGLRLGVVHGALDEVAGVESMKSLLGINLDGIKLLN